MVWNRLCDETADPAALLGSLSKQGKQIALGTEVIYELAKTFRSGSSQGQTRGIQLFTYLEGFVNLSVPCVKPNPLILRAEAEKALGAKNFDFLLDPRNYENMRQAVKKLAAGVFDANVDSFISSIEAENAAVRGDLVAQYSVPSPVRSRLAAVSDDQLPSWLVREARLSGRRLLRESLRPVFPQESQSRLTLTAKKMLAAHLRVSEATVRSNSYANWRCVRNLTISRDLVPDLDHVINAAYCDVYATMEASQGKYAPLVLTRTRVAIYTGTSRVSDWLVSI